MREVAPYIIPEIITPFKGETREEFLKRWEEDYEAGREPVAPPQNVRHLHNPAWRGQFWSIQSVHDASAGKTFNFWTVIKVLLYLATMTGTMWGASLKYRSYR